MDEKVGFVVESIRKLLALSVPDEEIINELKGVGISKEEAIQLIKTARAPPVAPAEEKKSQAPVVNKTPKEIYTEPSAQLSMDDQIVTQLGLESSTKVKNTNSSSAASAAKVLEVAKEKEEIEESDDEGDDKDVKDISPEEVDFGVKIKSTPNKKEIVQNEVVGKVVPNVAPVSPAVNAKSVSAEIPKIDIPNFSSSQNISQAPAQNISTTSSAAQTIPPVAKESLYSQNQFSSKLGELSSKLSSQNYTSSSVSTEDVDALWKKGIVVAVNSKLSEMKKLKDEIDVSISDKVDSSVKKEVAQLKVLLDSQRDLLISSNKASLEEKQREITFIIDAKIAELKQYNKQLSDNLTALESAKAEQKLALTQLGQALDDARKTKAQLLVEMNAELIKSKSSAQAFLDNSDKHLKDLDERVNRTLELEKNIADGMLAQAEQKIEALTIQKADELINELEIRLNKLKATEASINPEALQQKVAILDDFKKQFITTMKDNITQINTAINDLNQKNTMLDKQIQEKMLTIDAKIEELTKFEKEFTLILETALKK